jgi:hypothetical protein
MPVASPVCVVDPPCHVDASADATSMQHNAVPEASADQKHDEPQDDAVSVTDTVLYGQEPFETLQHKVVGLAAKVFRRNPRDISVHEMKGGTYNRVIGVKIWSKPKMWSWSWSWFMFRCLSARKKKAAAQCKSYIVRVPRTGQGGDDAADAAEYMAEDMKLEVAILKTAASRLPLPIPDVASYDLTTENIFERPYMIQTRLPGGNLAMDIWDSLNEQQKGCIAKQVTALASTIASVEGPAGDISSRNLSRPSKAPISVDTFYMADYDDQPSSRPASICKPVEFLLERCEQYRALEAFEGVSFDDVWVSFARISKALEARGFLNGPCVLVHGDLKIYNLLAEVRSDTEAVITGVIDWDSAIIAPEFMAYRAPFWLWAPEELTRDDEDQEHVANIEPTIDEDKALKQVFLDNASDKYKLFAFAPEAMLARRMFAILQKGMPGSWDLDEAKSVVREWNKLHPEDGVRYVCPEDSDSEAESDSESASDSESVSGAVGDEPADAE